MRVRADLEGYGGVFDVEGEGGADVGGRGGG